MNRIVADLMRNNSLVPGLQTVALVLLVLLLLPFILMFALMRFLLQLSTLAIIWLCWSLNGNDLLIVYSNSPIWINYFEKGLLPIVGSRAHVLNWSERKRWPAFSLKTITFALFRSEKEFNPMLIRFDLFKWPEKISFYAAFHDSKHGKDKSLLAIENRLSQILNQSINLREYYPCSLT